MLSEYDLVWDKIENIPDSWSNGGFAGNGCMGVNVYIDKEKNRLHIELGRNDIYDNRPVRDFWMARQFDTPRLPIGYLEYPLGEEIESFCIRQNLYDAVISVKVEGKTKKAEFDVYVSAVSNVVVIDQKKGRSELWELIPREAVSPRQSYGINHGEEERIDCSYEKNPSPVVEKSGEYQWINQALHGQCHTITTMKCDLNKKKICLTTEQGINLDADTVIFHLESYMTKAGILEHTEWWHNYYGISKMEIPDKKLQQFYWIQIYKLACITRENGRVIDNQGPWITETPWPGTWWNLNVQLCYWPLYTSNRMEIGKSLNHTIDRYRSQLKKNVPKEYQYDSMAIGTNSTKDLESPVANPLKDNGKQFVELGNLTWVMHNCWIYYRMTMDQQFLEQTLYPVLRESINYYLHFVYEREDGTYHLPATESPEYGIACEDCNYDLSLLKWGCETLMEITQILNVTDIKYPVWRMTLKKLVDYPCDENGYMIGENLPYAKSHRHFSHLMMLSPLYLVNKDNSSTYELAHKSVQWWHSLKGDIEGFSNVGASLIYSAYKNGNMALKYVNHLWDGYILDNTFYKEAGPVMETPLAAAECIQQLLLQSWGGKVRVFPAMPDCWSRASFLRFAAQGGFVVSARYEDGKTQWIKIYSKAGEPCILETDIKFATITDQTGLIRHCEIDKTISLTIEKGCEISLTRRA